MTGKTQLTVTIAFLALAPAWDGSDCRGQECVNPCAPVCATGTYLGVVCGDLGADALTLTGCGGGWLRFNVQECSDLAANLSFVSILTTPDDGTVYELRAMRDCVTLVGSDTDPSQRRKRIYVEWADGWGFDDSRDLGLELRVVSGTPSGNWRLEVLGNASIVTDAPDARTRPQMLRQVFPNPFNPLTAIRFDLSVGGVVRLEVYDVRGKRVRTLVDEDLPVGSHEAVWDGRDSTGRAMASGLYFARLSAGGKVETVRMGLVR